MPYMFNDNKTKCDFETTLKGTRTLLWTRTGAETGEIEVDFSGTGISLRDYTYIDIVTYEDIRVTGKSHLFRLDGYDVEDYMLGSDINVTTGAFKVKSRKVSIKFNNGYNKIVFDNASVATLKENRESQPGYWEFSNGASDLLPYKIYGII